MWLLLLVAVILLMVILIPFIAYYTSTWKPATLNQSSILAESESYNIPSAWSTSLPVKDSSCQVYTFVSTNGEVPQPSLRRLEGAATALQPIKASCVDADQILAQKMYHLCRYGDFQNLPLAQFNGCPKLDGSFTKLNGYYEEYYNVCGNPVSKQKVGTGAYSSVTADTSTRCPGSVGLIMFNYQSSLAGGICLREPIYETDGSNIIMDPEAPLLIARTGLTLAGLEGKYPTPGLGCSLSETQHGFPAQLFRVVRHAYSKGNFKVDNNGNWVNIVHRPTGKYVAPYTLTEDGSDALLSRFIPDFKPILVPANSFNGKGNWWYMTSEMLMPATLLRGPRPDPDPGAASTVVGSPSWDGKYWLDERRAAKPQLVWAPDPVPIAALRTEEESWHYFTSTESLVYTLVPYRRQGLEPDFSQMSLTPFLTYPLFTQSPIDQILPATDPNSPYYPTQLNLKSYAAAHKDDAKSACLNYDVVQGGYLIPDPLKPLFKILVPIAWTSPCAKEYVADLTRLYELAIAGAKERLLAEYGSFQYIDLALYPTIMQDVGDFFKQNA